MFVFGSSCRAATATVYRRRQATFLSHRPIFHQNFVGRRARQSTLEQQTFSRCFSSTSSSDAAPAGTNNTVTSEHASDSSTTPWTPWNKEATKKKEKKRNNNSRFRQHVNPLARRYQHPTVLAPEWPRDVFSDLSLPLHLDIGCGKGGFLLDMAAARHDFNFLGLEIRPSVFQYALERIEKRGLTGRLAFVGCNANVDLERLLTLHQESDVTAGALETVSIQFPDPHFKASHAKRRVVTAELVRTLAKFLPEDAVVFLQSDVQSVLDDMRMRFRQEDAYFLDEIADDTKYMEENPIGVETERERSVLERGLPVYRTVFRRTSTPFVENE